MIFHNYEAYDWFGIQKKCVESYYYKFTMPDIPEGMISVACCSESGAGTCTVVLVISATPMHIAHLLLALHMQRRQRMEFGVNISCTFIQVSYDNNNYCYYNFQCSLHRQITHSFPR